MKDLVGFSENKETLPRPCCPGWSYFFSISRISPKTILVREKHSVCLFKKKKVFELVFSTKFWSPKSKNFKISNILALKSDQKFFKKVFATKNAFFHKFRPKKKTKCFTLLLH